MSIINDALKKVEKSLAGGNSMAAAGKNIPPAAPKAKINPVRKDSSNGINKYFIYALIFVFGLFLENTFFQYFFEPQAGFSETPLPAVQSSQIQLSSQEPMELPIELAAQPLPETIQLTALEPPPPPLPAVEEKEEARLKETALVLNGIFFSQDNGYYALINNKIVKEGDAIDGSLVKSIELNNVELESKGGKLVNLSKDR